MQPSTGISEKTSGENLFSMGTRPAEPIESSPSSDEQRVELRSADYMSSDSENVMESNHYGNESSEDQQIPENLLDPSVRSDFEQSVSKKTNRRQQLQE